jgi:hypothetical protein
VAVHNISLEERLGKKRDGLDGIFYYNSHPSQKIVWMFEMPFSLSPSASLLYYYELNLLNSVTTTLDFETGSLSLDFGI